jgi:membrane-anchored protein YejM (alkaline phosphatase superfamily)
LLVLAANDLALLGVCSAFVASDAFASALGGAWMVAVYLTYPLFYLAPAALVAWLGERAIRGAARGARGPLVSAIAWTPAVVAFSAVQVVLYADRRVHALYGFHLNGFVWNLLTTSGGLASLGAGPTAELAAGGLVAAIAAAEAGVVAVAVRLAARRRSFVSRRALVAIAVGVTLVSCGERLTYAAARLYDYRPVLAYGDAFPFYLTSSFGHLARTLGIGPPRARRRTAGLPAGAELAYPLRPIAFRADAPRWNVVVLCSESLRADALDTELMPATWRFASAATRFTAHVSAGNGTRMGVFGLFYGLPGPYWFELLDRERGPVLLDALQRRGYDVRGFTSAVFEYPEFDRTVFADVDRSHLREERVGRSWERDRALVDDIGRFLAERDRSQPFFLYAFFESPHARYDFPPETAIRTPYLADFDYVTMDVHRDIALIRNRYWNSVRHLDTQLARVFDALAANGLTDSTIVVVTGDHGEEFLEAGHWGHNSAFTEGQIRTPFVLRVPGRAPAVETRLTSHLDVAPTLLDALGAENPPSDYALGTSLLSAADEPFAVVSDWSRLAYVDATGKATFPTRRVTFFQQEVANRDDRPLADASAWLAAHADRFKAVLSGLGRFTSAKAARASN